MKIRSVLLPAIMMTLAWAPAYCADTHTVDLSVVYKGDTYSFAQAAEEGSQSTFSGQVSNGNGTERSLIFNSMIRREGDGNFRLQYQVELGGPGGKGKPPVQLQADFMLPPNRRVLAAQGGDWKVYLKIKARAVKNVNTPSAKDSRITANAVLTGMPLPLSLIVSPGTQSSYVATIEKNGMPYNYVLNLLAGQPDRAGEFTLQYQLNFKGTGTDAVQTSGETRLKPGSRLKTAAKGDNWQLEVRAAKP